MNTDSLLDINLSTQTLTLILENRPLKIYQVSTAKNGPGEVKGSECTPRGWHKIRAKIGADCPVNTVFVGRRPTGELYSAALAEQFPKRDWILTRILWLSGVEPGINRYGNVDSAWRYIYIHGTPDSVALGVPGSHGCVRMANADVIELFQQIPIGFPVWLHE
ncbi:L,D-transpeptidase [Methylocucumis oryzae]|uniref:ErfK/YbiS/YcfS/YnhG family protein n=1 Tax=Methylocucumis oryzae TaxID=1632867 RepID=A0A0F3IIW2_9GAMM|nr:L,D-transpeptidase [Methylocucumis oryzae]KJV06671.1 ErfK/YbiS/YcfS/YnhG family protein [Methylocucumis oryzae]